MSLMALSSDPSFPPKSSASQPLRRSGRARTTRVRDDFFDVDILQYVASPDEPMAFADEGMPATQHKKSPGHKASTPPITVPLDYQQADDRPVGPSFQATNIPVCRPRPPQPSARDARFLQATLLCAPGSSDTTAAAVGAAAAAAAAAVFKAQYIATPDCAGRRVLLDAAVAELDAQMGPRMVQVLSLGLLGAKCRSKWQKHEELLFCLGMCDKYRMFKYIRQCYLWSRSAHELNGYYNNVWKTRSTPEADEFLALREGHASSADMQDFVDKVRDQLISMWDRKKMGDMPKLLKDAAAAAAADAELFAAAAGLNPQDSEADEDYASPSSSAGAMSGDSGSSGRAAASKPPRQRKRPAAAAVSSKQGRVQVKRGVTPPVQQLEAADVQGIQQQQQQRGQVGSVKQEQQQQRGQARSVKQEQQQQQQQQPKRQRLQQQQQQTVGHQPAQGASAAAAAAAAAATDQGATKVEPAADPMPEAGGVSRLLPFPEMPTYPDPDMTNPDDVSSWLTHLPVYRGVISTYMQTVNSVADTAVAGYQQRILEVQQHRDRLQAEADAYIRGLLAQGKQVLQRVQAGTANSMQQQAQQQQQQQQQGHEVSAAPAQQQQHQQQPQQPGPAAGPAGAAAPAAGDLQSAVQALLSNHGHRTKKHVQAKQAVLQQQAVTQVQQQQEPMGADEAAYTLPFPGGPANKWLVSKIDAQAAAPSAGDGGDLADTPCGGGASSSEECDMFLACTEPAVC